MRKVISNSTPLIILDEMLNQGFYVSENIIKLILKSANEI